MFPVACHKKICGGFAMCFGVRIEGSFVRAATAALSLALALCCTAARADDWPMLGHDPGRSGATADEVRPPFERKWYRAFVDEGLMAGVQPVVADGSVYVGTLRGVVHAIDAKTGTDRWTFQAGGAVLHSCAADGGKVFFGAADGKIYALNAADGTLSWSVQTGSAVWNAPVVFGGTVIVGGRDGKLYARHAASGGSVWTRVTGNTLLGSPAIDVKHGRVVVGCEEMTVCAFDLREGTQRWRSVKLPGCSFRGYHPVIAPDGSVLITTQPAAGGDAMQQVLLDMTKEVFGDFASWRHKKDENEKLREQNFKLMGDPATYARQMAYLRKRLSDEPALQTFFVLDGETGKQKVVTPIVYAESMNGPGSPAVVTADGKVVVKYSALLRSRYEHYSPFLNVGYLDTASGDIAPAMDQSRTYGWHDSLLLVHDEQSQLSAGGNVLFNAHQDNVNALDLSTRRGFEQPLCHNVHEPPAGAAVGIWATHLDGRPLPMGWEWFARGTAVYGGGSAIDVPVAVAGDSFYYVPTHEINSGCVVLAYRMKKDGNASKKAPPAAGKLSAEQWKAVQWSGRWDWDTLESPRLNETLKALPELVEGTRRRPLTEAAKARVASLPDDRFTTVLYSMPENRTGPRGEKLKRELESAVAELIATRWRPLVLPAGKAPAESYRFFTDPSETLYTLALAFPHLSPGLQDRVTQHVARLRMDGGPLAGPTGAASYDVSAGTVRTAFDPAPDRLLKLAAGVPPRSDTARLYPMWLWAREADDWDHLKASWPALRELVRAEADGAETDCGNARVGGLIAAWRMAREFKDEEAEKRLTPMALSAMRERLQYEFAHPKGGLIGMNHDNRRAVFSRWRNLTPDVAGLLRLHAQEINAGLMDLYVDHHRPTWWLAWNVETLWANEVPVAFPTHAQEIFAARAMILNEPGDALAKFVDRPWCRGDEYYIQKLAMAIGNANGARW